MTSFPWPVPTPGDLRVRRGRDGCGDRPKSRRVVHRALGTRVHAAARVAGGEIVDTTDGTGRGWTELFVGGREDGVGTANPCIPATGLGHPGVARSRWHSSGCPPAFAVQGTGWGRLEVRHVDHALGHRHAVTWPDALLQTSGGEIPTVMDKERAGHDIRWAPATGGDVSDQAERPSLLRCNERLVAEQDSPYRFQRFVDAGKKFPRLPGTARVLAVGFPGFIPTNRANRISAQNGRESWA